MSTLSVRNSLRFSRLGRPPSELCCDSNPRFTRVLSLVIFTIVCMKPCLLLGQDVGETFLQSQVLNEWSYIDNPVPAQQRLAKIWRELYSRTGNLITVIPLQTNHGGMAVSPSTILIDPSILADPNEEVTRFLLAHEWGHVRNGDPLKSLTPLGQYSVLTAGTAIEDGADLWATFFMNSTHHSVRPIMRFFCSLPIVPGDTHTSGPGRAARVALHSDILEDNPCDDFPETARHELTSDPALAQAIRALASAIKTGLTSSIEIPRNGKYVSCDLSVDSCAYFVNHSVSMAGSQVAFNDLSKAVDITLPDWRRSEYRCPSKPDQLRDFVWFPTHNGDPGMIEEQLSNTRSPVGYTVVLSFNSDQDALRMQTEDSNCHLVLPVDPNALKYSDLNAYFDRVLAEAPSDFVQIRGETLPDGFARSKIDLAYGGVIVPGKILPAAPFHLAVVQSSATFSDLTPNYTVLENRIKQYSATWPTKKESGTATEAFYESCQTSDGPCILVGVTNHGSSQAPDYQLAILVTKRDLK